MTGAEALEVARTASPSGSIEHDGRDPLSLEPGAKVAVSADDYGRDRITGTLVAANAEHVVIAREDADLGALHVHFPRVGYIVVPA